MDDPPDPLAIFWAGVDAGRAGTDPRLCPHDPMTREYHEWQRGQAWGCEVVFGTEDAGHE